MCHFWDQTDIEWWNKYKLPLKHIISPYGKIKDEVPVYGTKISDARVKILEDLDKGVLAKLSHKS